MRPAQRPVRWPGTAALCLLLSTPLGAQAEDARPSDQEVGAAYAAARGRKRDLADLCIRRPRTFPVVVVGINVGYGDLDQPFGCVLDGVMISGSLVDAGPGARTVFASHGWGQLSAVQRQRLALRWVREVQLAFEPVLERLPAGPARQIGFVAPRTAMAGDGVVVTAVSRPSYAGPIDVYRKWQFRFAPDGALLESKLLRQIERSWKNDPVFLKSDGRTPRPSQH